MGKQINYWMDYDNFVLLAKKALELGCVIYRREHADENGKIVFGEDISIVIPDEHEYWFYFPNAGGISVETINGREYIHRADGGEQALIEAGFSYISAEKKKITRSRIWCSTGFYNEDGIFIYRPEQLTKAYNALAGYVKKIAPYTELTDVYISRREEDYGKEVEYKHKEYVSQFCKGKMTEGYKLVMSL